MADPLLAGDGLWEVLERLLPERPAQRIGRPRVEDRVAFTAIMFVLVTGLPWRLVPEEIGCSGVTAWRQLTAPAPAPSTTSSSTFTARRWPSR
jgi:transposase